MVACKSAPNDIVSQTIPSLVYSACSTTNIKHVGLVHCHHVLVNLLLQVVVEQRELVSEHARFDCFGFEFLVKLLDHVLELLQQLGHVLTVLHVLDSEIGLSRRVVEPCISNNTFIFKIIKFDIQILYQ